MRKIIAIMISILIFCLGGITVSAEAAMYETAGDLFQAWCNGSAQRPDYICGVWSTDGGYTNLTFGIQNTDEGKRGKQEILDMIVDDSTVSFEYQKYSENYLNQIQEEIIPYFQKDLGMVSCGVYVMENRVEIEIHKDRKNDPATKEMVKEFKEKYGDENVHRVYGENRYGTSLAIAEELLEIREEKGLGGFDSFYFCSAGSFADALAISPVAGAQLNPILYAPAYSNDDCSLKSASPETLKFVRENKTDEIGEMVIVGGIYAVSEDAEGDLEEIVGPAGIHRVDAGMTGNRYDTMLVIAEVFKDVYVSDDTICVATGANFPDALAGSALASKLGCPIILVGYLDAPTNTQSSINSELCEYISEKELSDCYVFGGVYAVSDEQLELLLG